MAIHARLKQPRGPAPRVSTGSNYVADELRGLVLGGLVRPGEFLGTEEELAERFGVSRSVIREAVKGLEAVGMVEMRTGRGGGVSVATGNPAFFADALAIQLKLVGVSESELIDAQIATECVSSELAAQFATPADLEHLERLVKAAEASVRDLDECRRLSFEFHEALTAASKNRVLIAILRSMQHLRDAARGSFPSTARAKAVVLEHKALLASLRRGDGAGARKHMAQHLEPYRARALGRSRASKH